MEAKYELAAQSGNWGYYAVVAMEVDVLEGGPSLEIAFVERIHDWRYGVQFGIAYAYEKTILAQPRSRGVKVRVVSVLGHPVDTTEAAVAFAAAHAFCRAIGVALPQPPRLSESTGEFIFPK